MKKFNIMFTIDFDKQLCDDYEEEEEEEEEEEGEEDDTKAQQDDSESDVLLKQEKKQLSKNLKKFKKLLNINKNNNINKYFEKCDIDRQTIILNNMESICDINNIETPYTLKLIESDLNPSIKSLALKKVILLSKMDSSNSEYYKLKQWVDTFMNIPFDKYSYLPVTFNDGMSKCNEYILNSKKILDDAVYGLDDAKYQFLQLVGSWIANPKSVGKAIAIKGPMGTGKTTLVKEGISKVLGRNFSFIALGGATDSSFLEGHSYTYEGSKWGKIVDILINSNIMNPVIFMDELDKVSETPHGKEIIGLLTHLTDTTQNSCFRDKYFSEFELDLSRALFIFSYNDETKVNSILKDRMYQVETKGYTSKEKYIISTKYLLPKIRKNLSFKEDDIIFNKDIIMHIINNYTNNEKGVRNLKRCLEIIHTKLNLYRLLDTGTELFKNNISVDINFPVVLNITIVDKFLMNNNKDESWKNLYI
jgi:ATP-dependent Lon protease